MGARLGKRRRQTSNREISPISPIRPMPAPDTLDLNRRDFLKGSSFATLMTMMGGVQLLAQTAPEKTEEEKPEGPKVKVAVIGLGPWGREILDQLGRIKKAEIAALCDNYPAMVRRSATKAPGATQVEAYKAIL